MKVNEMCPGGQHKMKVNVANPKVKVNLPEIRGLEYTVFVGGYSRPRIQRGLSNDVTSKREYKVSGKASWFGYTKK